MLSGTKGNKRSASCAAAVTESLQSCPTANPRTVGLQAPLSTGFSRQEFWSGLPCPPPGDLRHPGIEAWSPESPALAGKFLPLLQFGTLRDIGYCCSATLFSDVPRPAVRAVMTTMRSDAGGDAAPYPPIADCAASGSCSAKRFLCVTSGYPLGRE